jgi:hypothetical protein
LWILLTGVALNLHSRIGVLGIGVLFITANSSALASTYDALCNEIACKISLDGRGIAGPVGFIPAHRIAQWYTGGGEEHNAAASAAGATGGALGGAFVGAVATCWTIILCPIGIIGGGVAGGMGGSRAGKSADFYFSVVGYNQEGKKTILSFNFLNKKPAKKMLQELPVMSGLGMGEMRSIEAIRAGDSRAADYGTGKPQLPETIENASSKPKSASLPETLGESLSTMQPVKAEGAKCWSDYLKLSGMNEWAKANSAAAQRLKNKYSDC